MKSKKLNNINNNHCTCEMCGKAVWKTLMCRDCKKGIRTNTNKMIKNLKNKLHTKWDGVKDEKH